jgi:outer membrane murein-binding lipoprotein Lpp
MAKKAKAKRLAKEVAALTAEVAGLKTQMARLRTEQRAALKAETDPVRKKL